LPEELYTVNHKKRDILFLTCRDSSNLLESGRRPVRSQIPLRYLVADRFESGRRPAL